ncbi:DUF7171 family protein [Rhodococcus sp. NPDC055112]
MAIVKENPNGDKGTVEGMAKYSFMSSPPEQFEHVPTPGEQRVMSVTVECKAVMDEKVDEGVRKHVKWKVVEAEIGSMAKRAPEKPDEPELPYGSGEGDDYGDYNGSGADERTDSEREADEQAAAARLEIAKQEDADDESESGSNVHPLPSFSGNA